MNMKWKEAEKDAREILDAAPNDLDSGHEINGEKLCFPVSGMEHVASVDPRALLAVQPYRGINDVRYFLNGIHVALNGDVVATDGHCLGLVREQAVCAPGLGEGGLILQLARKLQMSAAKPLSIGTAYRPIHVFRNDCAERGALVQRGAKDGQAIVVPVHLIDGKFPDYDPVIPRDLVPIDRWKPSKECSGDVRTLAYRTEHLARIGETGKAIAAGEKQTPSALPYASKTNGCATWKVATSLEVKDGIWALVLVMPMRGF